MPSHTITVTLSDAAQRAAIVAGEPAARTQAYEVPQELMARLLALPWTRVLDDGAAACTVPTTVGYSRETLREPVGTPVDVPNPYSAFGSIAIRAETRPADAAAAIAWAEEALAEIQQAIDERRVAEQAERAERERKARARAEAWAALPLDWRASAKGVGRCTREPGVEIPDGPLSPSGYTWVPEDDLRAHAPAAYAEAVDETERLRAAEQAERERDRDMLRQWARQHGSELLRARVAHEADGASWDKLAREEWAEAQLARLDLGWDEATVPNGYDSPDEVEDRKSPTLDELRALDAVRERIGALELPATAELLWVTYTPQHDEYGGRDDDAPIRRAEVRIEVKTPDGASVCRDFLV